MRKVVIVGLPPVQIPDVAGPLEVFSNAPDYEVVLANLGTERSLQTNRTIVLGMPRRAPRSLGRLTR